MRSRVVARTAYSLPIVGVVVAACGSTPAPSSFTWKVDCVRVLGIPTPSYQTPATAIPVPAGVPRDVTFAELTDTQLGEFSDWAACLGGGYGHGCCTSTECPAGYDGTPPGPFQLETTPILASAMSTCYTPPNPDDVILGSREMTMALFRTTLLASCHVGLYEDCEIETIPSFTGGWAPDCAELNAFCDLSD
jgi:hypothetical protein